MDPLSEDVSQKRIDQVRAVLKNVEANFGCIILILFGYPIPSFVGMKWHLSRRPNSSERGEGARKRMSFQTIHLVVVDHKRIFCLILRLRPLLFGET